MPYRTVVEEPFFVDELENLRKSFPNIYDIKDAICWELSRRPSSYELIPGETIVRIYNTFPIGKAPAFRVLYKYDENSDPRVFLLSISPSDGTEE